MSIKVRYCTAYDDAYSLLGDYTYNHNSAGLSELGVSCVLERERLSDRPHSWDKILILLRELENTEYVLWVDSDILILNFGKLYSFINRMVYEDKTMCYGTGVMTGVNGGLLLVKNCEQVFDFLYNVWAQDQYACPNVTWWEQCAIRHVLGFSGGWRKSINKTYDPSDKFKSVPRGSRFPMKQNPYRESTIISPYGDMQCASWEAPTEYPDVAAIHAYGSKWNSLQERLDSLSSWL